MVHMRRKLDKQLQGNSPHHLKKKHSPFSKLRFLPVFHRGPSFRHTRFAFVKLGAFCLSAAG